MEHRKGVRWMKPRKVMVHLEVRSDVPVKKLMEKGRWVWRKDAMGTEVVDVHQVTAQVVRESK